MSATENVLNFGWNGVNPVRMEVNSAGHQKVNIENSSITVTPSGIINTSDVNTHSKLDSLNYQELNKDGFAQVLLSSAGGTAVRADTTAVVQEDPENRDGWNITNSVGGTKFNLYYFDGTQEIVTLGELLSLYFKAFINNNTEDSSMPYLQIYTKPTGVGDAGPFYHSRINYEYNEDNTIGIGEECIFYAEEEPSTGFNNRKIKLNNKVVLGDGASSEEVLYLVVASNSTATQNAVNVTINLLGFNTSSIKRNLCLKTTSTGITTNDTTTHSLLTDLNSNVSTSAKQDIQSNILTSIDGKITYGNDDTLADALQCLTYGRKDTSPTGLRALKCLDNGTLHTYDEDLSNKISKGEDSTITGGTGGLQQILLYGKDTTNDLHVIKVSNQGDIDVEIADYPRGQQNKANSFSVTVASDNILEVKQNGVNRKGSENNIENNLSILPGAISSLNADISSMKNANILYNDSNTSSFDSVVVEVSGDNGTTYNPVSEIYPYQLTGTSVRSAYLTINVGGLTNMRIRNVSSTDTYTNVNCSVYGSP